MSAALIAQHEIPAPSLEVIPLTLVERQAALVARAGELAIADPATFEQGNALLVELHQTAKAIEARRTELKKPITALGKLVDSIAAQAADPLDAAKRSLQGKVVAWQREQQRIADEARRAAELERARLEEERRRQEAEARAKAAAEQRRLEAEARAKAEAEARELEDVLGAPVAPAPVVVAVVQVELPPPVPAAPAPVIAAPKATAVQTRRVQRLEITDRAAVPCVVGGVELRPVDEAAVRRLLLTGVPVPGCRMVEIEELAMARAR